LQRTNRSEDLHQYLVQLQADNLLLQLYASQVIIFQ
jgi:hypothetical protein